MSQTSPEIKIRRAQTGDIPAVFALLEDICKKHCEGRPDIFRPGTKYSSEQLEKIFSNPETPVFVAEDGGRVAGYVFCILKRRQGIPILKDMLTVYIDDFCVDPGMRSRGIGKMLFCAVKEFAATLGAYNITLNVWEFNTRAIKFYESIGMKTASRTMEFILPGDIPEKSDK